MEVVDLHACPPCEEALVLLDVWFDPEGTLLQTFDDDLRHIVRFDECGRYALRCRTGLDVLPHAEIVTGEVRASHWGHGHADVEIEPTLAHLSVEAFHD